MIEETSQTNNTKKNVFLPFWFSLILVVGIIFGIYLSSRFYGNSKQSRASSPKSDKITQLLNYIQREYVDTINNERLVDSAIRLVMLQPAVSRGVKSCLDKLFSCYSSSSVQ